MHIFRDACDDASDRVQFRLILKRKAGKFVWRKKYCYVMEQLSDGQKENAHIGSF